MIASIAVVIASKNRPDLIGRAVSSILEQPTQPDRILVVDQSSTRYALEAAPALEHIYDPRIPGLTVARNVAIDATDESIVLFLDDDAELASDAIPAIRAAFLEHPDAVGVQCFVEQPVDRETGQRPGLGNAAWRRWEDIFYRGFFDNRLGRISSESDEIARVHGCAMAFRRELFARERFDEGLVNYSYGEDFEFSKRAIRHGKLFLVPGAHVIHHETATNRLKQRRLFAQRWRNMLYFYDRMPQDRRPIDALWRLWWMLGETIVWLKKGYGLPTTRPSAE